MTSTCSSKVANFATLLALFVGAGCSAAPERVVTSEPEPEPEPTEQPAAEPTAPVEEPPPPQPVTTVNPEPEPPPPPPPVCQPLMATAKVDEAILSTTPATGARVWIVRAKERTTYLTFTVRAEEGQTTQISGVFGPEQLKPNEANVTLLVQTDCNIHGDHFHCGPSYIAKSGTWEVDALPDAVGQPVRVKLSADLMSVTIRKGVATPTNKPDLCLAALGLSGTLKNP